MILKLLMVAGGLLAVLAAGVFVRRTRNRSRITTEHLSGDWLAHARGREEQQW